jgi:hypothetical protein
MISRTDLSHSRKLIPSILTRPHFETPANLTDMSTKTRVPRDIGHGISVIDFPAEVLVHAKYRLNENNTNIGEIIDYASTEQIPDKDASIGMTWNGRKKRYAATFKVVSQDGTEQWLNSVDFTPSYSFNVTDKDHPEEQRAAVSFGWSKPNKTADCESIYTLVTKDFVYHPSAVVEAAPITSYTVSMDD